MRKAKVVLVSLAALVGLFSVPPASGNHAFGCTDQTGGETLISVGAFAAAFAPHCVIVDSGERVKWTNADAFDHDPGDDGTGGACWQVETATNRELEPLENFTIALTWDSSISRFNVEAWDTNGNQVVWPNGSTTKTCGSALHTNQPDGTKFIPYICYNHPDTMSGGIVVRV